LFYFIKQRWDRDFKSQINYGVDELQASILEAYKDLPIAIVSFDCPLPRIGYKKSHAYWSAMVTLACVGMYFGNSFNMAKVLFATVGVSCLIKSPSTLDWYCY
jgi:hypothetical protein